MTQPLNPQALLSGNEMIQILLPIHILAGIFALISAALAVSSEKGKRLHVLSGRTYFWGMATIFLTAIPMSIISSNIFLFLIAIFSFYLAFAGMRFARNRKGVATILDWIAICLMIFSGIGMWVLAAIYFLNSNTQPASRYFTVSLKLFRHINSNINWNSK